MESDKDKAIKEIMDWASLSRKTALHYANRHRLEKTKTKTIWADGRMSAFDDMIDYCESMLNHRSMPSEAPHQNGSQHDADD